MVKKIKSIALGIAIIAVTVLAVILRCNSDRSGIQSDIDRAGRIEDGVRELGESEQRIKEHLNDAEGRSDDISKHNKTAKTGIQSAIDILKAAKERTDSK